MLDCLELISAVLHDNCCCEYQSTKFKPLEISSFLCIFPCSLTKVVNIEMPEVVVMGNCSHLNLRKTGRFSQLSKVWQNLKTWLCVKMLSYVQWQFSCYCLSSVLCWPLCWHLEFQWRLCYSNKCLTGHVLPILHVVTMLLQWSMNYKSHNILFVLDFPRKCLSALCCLSSSYSDETWFLHAVCIIWETDVKKENVCVQIPVYSSVCVWSLKLYF